MVKPLDQLPRAALAGLVAWALVVAVRSLQGAASDAEQAELIVLFLPLVVVPLALREEAPLLAAAGAALALGVVVSAPGDAVAAALAVPWLVACGVVAAPALGRLARRLPERPLDASGTVIDVGRLVLPVAALWLLAYRAGFEIAGFGGLSAILTAGHFHAAGFATMVLAGLIGHGLAAAGAGPRTLMLHRALCVAVVVAFLLLAVGIGLHARVPEVLGAALYGLALPCLAALQLVAARGPLPMWARGALVVSSACLLLSTTFALLFAREGFSGDAVSIPVMLRFHAAVNAIGFLGLAYLAWCGTAGREVSGAGSAGRTPRRPRGRSAAAGRAPRTTARS